MELLYLAFPPHWVHLKQIGKVTLSGEAAKGLELQYTTSSLARCIAISIRECATSNLLFLSRRLVWRWRWRSQCVCILC